MIHEDLFHWQSHTARHDIICHLMETIFFINSLQYQDNPERVLSTVLKKDRFVFTEAFVRGGILRGVDAADIPEELVEAYCANLRSVDPECFHNIVTDHIAECQHCTKLAVEPLHTFTIGMSLPESRRDLVLQEFSEYLATTRSFPFCGDYNTDESREGYLYYFETVKQREPLQHPTFPPHKSLWEFVDVTRRVRKKSPRSAASIPRPTLQQSSTCKARLQVKPPVTSSAKVIPGEVSRLLAGASIQEQNLLTQSAGRLADASAVHIRLFKRKSNSPSTRVQSPPEPKKQRSKPLSDRIEFDSYEDMKQKLNKIQPKEESINKTTNLSWLKSLLEDENSQVKIVDFKTCRKKILQGAEDKLKASEMHQKRVTVVRKDLVNTPSVCKDTQKIYKSRIVFALRDHNYCRKPSAFVK